MPTEPMGPDMSHPRTEAAKTVHDLRAVFATGRTRPIEWRLRQLEGIERLVVEREDEIATALAADLGRNAVDSWLGDVASVRAEAAFARKNLRKWMRRTTTGLPLTMRPGKAFISYEPLGVVLVIGPWNYPVYLSLGPMVGAVAAGNCIVLKPSEHAPATSALLARLIPEYLDSEAIAVVEGEAQATQDLLAQGVDHAFFTGGPEIGKAVMAAAAPHLTPVTLELGGKSPAVITGQADVKIAARRIAWTKFVNSGQTCIAPDYVLVDASVRDAFVSELTQAIAAMQGPSAMMQIVNRRQYDRLSRLLDDNGGKVALGGHTDASSNRIAPTVVVDPDPASTLMQEEIFGPILPVLGVDSLPTAIDFVNSREKPLAAYLFSAAKDEHERFISEVAAGGMVINQAALHVLVPQLPFGGVGDSGMGTYHGRWGFETFSHRKSVLVKSLRPDPSIMYPPYGRLAQKVLRRVF
jgi:aldehyde dehydrogenase (NAD+)